MHELIECRGDALVDHRNQSRVYIASSSALTQRLAVVAAAAAAATVVTVKSAALSLLSLPMSNTWYMFWAGGAYPKLEDMLHKSIELRLREYAS